VVVDARRLTDDRDEACARVARLEVMDDATGAGRAGMLEADYRAIRGVAQSTDITLTFRDSNPSCVPHLAAGVRSKPHEVLQKTWDPSNLDAAHANLAGLVSNLLKKPPRGEVIPDPQLTLRDGEPLTCDYDLMDEIEIDGTRVPGETPRDLRIRSALNDAIPPTPLGHRDRVLHGAQTGYSAYLLLHPDEAELTALFKPEAPLIAFRREGRVLFLETVEDALNFYRCEGTKPLDVWNVHAQSPDGTSAPAR
jgi:hypothetical protein